MTAFFVGFTIGAVGMAITILWLALGELSRASESVSAQTQNQPGPFVDQP